MFYSLELLQKRGGQFGIIWVAATEGTKLNKRQITGVRLRKACNDIIDYIMVRAPLPVTGQSRKRFSLYLSSQLMYGVVKIYGKQNDYLLSDATTFMSRLRLASFAQTDIDLKEIVSEDMVTFPDPTHVTSTENEFFDISFGCLTANTKESLFAHEKLKYSSASDLDEMLSPEPIIRIAPFKPEDIIGSPNTVSSLDEITMKQMPLQSEMPTMSTIAEDLVLGFPDLHEQQQAIEQVEMPSVLPQSPVLPELSDIPIVPVLETPIHRPEQEVTKMHKNMRSPDVTPEPKEKRSKKRSSVKLVLEDIDIPEKKFPRRKHRRIIIDKEIQISRDTFKKNLINQNTSLPNILPDPKRKCTEDYFKTPGREIGFTLNHVFQRNCKLPETVVFSESESGSSFISLSSPVAPITSLPFHLPSAPLIPSPVQSSPTNMPDKDPQEAYSMEMVRDASLSVSTDKMISFDNSSLEGSTISLLDQSKPPEVIVTEIEPLHEISAVLEEEENFFMDQVDVPEPQFISPHLIVSTTKFIKQLHSATMDGNWTTFRTLVPTTLSKVTASKLFSRLLEQCKKGQISATQEEAYGEIYISRSH